MTKWLGDRELGQTEFNSMTRKERYYYFLGKSINVTKSPGISSTSKVGDDDRGRMYYRAECGDIIVSNWCNSENGAIEEARQYLSQFEAN